VSTQTAERNGVTPDGELIDEGQSLLEAAIANGSMIDKREASFIEMQLSAASRRPRSIKAFKDKAKQYATEDLETAESCSYTLPRDGKKISGPSIRLAEICMMAWGNLRAEARVIEIGEKEIRVAANAWDLETNTSMGQEVYRRITKKNGQRYSEDMIVTTLNAAASIALRNAIFRVIPKSLVEEIRKHCVKVVIGDERTIGQRRDEAVKFWAQKGIDEKRLAAACGKPSVADLSLEDLADLRGFAVAIRDKETTIEECFPVASPPTPLPTTRTKLPQQTAESPEHAEAILRIREELKRTGLTEAQAIKIIKATVKTLDEITLEQAYALQEDLAKRTG
jgi:hypothetical protein